MTKWSVYWVTEASLYIDWLNQLTAMARRISEPVDELLRSMFLVNVLGLERRLPPGRWNHLRNESGTTVRMLLGRRARYFTDVVVHGLLLPVGTCTRSRREECRHDYLKSCNEQCHFIPTVCKQCFVKSNRTVKAYQCLTTPWLNISRNMSG